MTTDRARDRVLAVVDANRDEIVQLLQHLVHIPSVNRSPSGDELACQRAVERIMREMDLYVDVFSPDSIPGIGEHPGWSPGQNYAYRPNVVGIRRGTGGGQSLLMLAHVDVVPEGPLELWRHGPFNPVVENGEVVGRGSNDDKGGLAALIMALRCVEAAGYRPAGDVILASAVDEESGTGNGTLAVLLRGHVADGAVCCDGLDLDIHTVSLGGGHCMINLQLRPEISTCRTIDRIMEILSILYQDVRLFGRERTDIFRHDPSYADTVWPERAVRIPLLIAGSADGSNVGAARMGVSFYVLPGEDPAAILTHIDARVRAITDRYAYAMLPPHIEALGRLMPPSSAPADHPFVNAVAAAYEVSIGHPATCRGMPMGDLFQFNLHSPRAMPTVAIGPGRFGVPGGAHESNESVLIDEHLIPLVKTLALLILDWCGCVPAAPVHYPSIRYTQSGGATL